MSETKFTPAPWTVARIHSNGNWLSMIVGDCKPIAEVNCDCLEASNAHLIAAAPEMLEALEDALATCEHDMQHILDNGRLRSVLRAAISKAKGEQK